jgi:hypothetical protein
MGWALSVFGWAYALFELTWTRGNWTLTFLISAAI